MLRKSLAAKLIFYIGIVLILTIGFFAYINTNAQKKFLIEEIKLHGIQLSQLIERSISNEMLSAQNDQIQKSLEDIGNSEVIENIRIFDKNGTIFWSDSHEEIGSSVDKTAEACFVCHGGEKPAETLPRADMTRIFKSNKDYRLLGIINPIYNEARCFNASCHFHPQEQSILGVMDILLPLDHFDRQLGANQRQTILYFLFIFLIIAVGMGLLIFMFVNRPISSLIAGTRRIAQGDLNHRIGGHHHSDEIGVLGKSFDSMTAELQKSGKEVARWNIKLENEVKKATENLEKANKKLQDLDSLKSNFLRKMEHGLRSHVGIIQSCLSLAFKEGQSGFSAQQIDLISTAKRRSAVLLEVLDDIVQLSYRQSASAEYFMEPVHITFVLHKVLENFRVQAQKKNISVEIQVPPDSLIIQADPAALEEAFSNLVNNAIKYTKRNGTVSLSAKEKENNITIDIIDSGIGIASEELPKIFNEFFRASNAKSNGIEGTGVGLAIVNEIIESHKGEIKVQSELGKGSTFTVVLPKST
ncbi:MAG: HAMP domain-containing histidine kinase [Candidatus Aminicenantes bacterium]|nr:HAMP domain-containing histidine kinase [Candidatus Aminicenantes bacterium]